MVVHNLLDFQAYVHIYISMPLCSSKGSEVNAGFWADAKVT